MKKKFIILLLCLNTVFALYAQEDEYSPMVHAGDSWVYDRQEYSEQDGYALILGRKVHYWLYDTYKKHDGDGSHLLNQVFPKWVEELGYVIDFDNIRKVSPNTSLASSVKALMEQRGCDVSVTLWQEKSGDYLYVNDYDEDNNTYSTIIYPLVK